MSRATIDWRRVSLRASLGLAVALIGAQGSAWANCSIGDSSSKPAARSAGFVSTGYHPGELGRSLLVRVRDERPSPKARRASAMVRLRVEGVT